jgi:hypothetical protein
VIINNKRKKFLKKGAKCRQKEIIKVKMWLRDKNYTTYDFYLHSTYMHASNIENDVVRHKKEGILSPLIKK